MSEYQLLGLDDYVAIDKYRKVKRQYLSSLEDYKDCLPTGKIVPNINNYDYNDPTFKFILANIFNVGADDDWSFNNTYNHKDGKYDPLAKYPQLLSTFTHGAVFKDNVNNTIIIGSSSRNNYFAYRVTNGVTDLFGVKRTNERYYFKEKADPNLTSAIYSYFVKPRTQDTPFIKELINSKKRGDKDNPINRQKVDVPIVIDISLEKKYFLGISPEMARGIVDFACGILSAIGLSSIAEPLKTLLYTAIDYAETKSLPQLKDLIVEGAKILGVNDTKAVEYIKKGVDYIDLYNQKNYAELLKRINLETGDQFGLQDKINSATEYFNSVKTTNPFIYYQLHKREHQAMQDAQLTSYATQAPTSFIQALKSELSGATTNYKFLQLITQIAVGRAADKNHLNFAALPPIETTQGSIARTLLDSGKFNTPELVKFVLDMDAGGMIDEDILNYLFIEQIEQQIRDYEIKSKGLGASNKKTIFLPYAIDTIKGSCIAKELNTTGYSVIWDGGRLDNTTKQIIIDNNPLSKTANYYLGD